MSATAIEQLIAQRVADALLDYEANQNSENGNGNGNGNGNDNGNGSHDSGSGSRRTLHTARGCMYKEFLNYQPLNFKGTERADATCTLLGGVLTWWNSYVRTVGHDAAYEISWKNLMKMMTKAYCPRNEIQKLENKMWNLTVKGTDFVGYTQRFQELSLLCSRMLPEETNKVERFIWGLPDNIQGNKDGTRDDQVQQPHYKRQNVARAYTSGPCEKKEYVGTLPVCNKCKYHHTGPCTTKCRNCKRIGHQTKDCRSLAIATNQRAPVANQRTLTCFVCGKQGHYHSECPELKKYLETKLEVVKHVEGCMLWEEEKTIKTLATL
ncbi:reverse transcriptase domain-containing protein [Tanacetum coccineum]